MDVIANVIAKMKNALSRKAPAVEVMKSGLVADLLQLMKKEGYINDFSDSQKSKYAITVSLKYFNGKPSIKGMKKISKLSKRVYTGADSVPRVFNNLGVAVITTSKGVLTDKEARALKVGGEVICYIW